MATKISRRHLLTSAGAGVIAGAGALVAASPALAAASPTYAQLLAKAVIEARNKALVLDFWTNVFDAQDISKAANYLAVDYIQHTPTVGQGLQGFIDAFSPFWPEPLPPAEIIPTRFVEVVASGDLVQLVQTFTLPDPDNPGTTYDAFWFDLYRVRGNLLVEHWDPATKPEAP
ncbi:MAG: nuclear transport factor 2 family protein [Luteimonas sp.]